MSAPLALLLDGAPPGDGVLATARGLHYGDGVFRTALVVDGAVHEAARALRILQRDAAALGLAVDPEPLAHEAAALARGQVRAVLKWMLWRSGVARGYRAEAAGSHRLLALHPLPAWAPSLWSAGARVDRAPVALAAQPVLAGIKHLNRLEQVLASRDWPAGIDERLMADTQGHAVCGTRSNLFWTRGGTLHTSALDQCGVAGAMRERVLEAAQRSGLPIDFTPQPLDGLQDADELFLTNSLIGLWPVREFAGRRWAAPGPVATALQRTLAHPRVST